MPKKGRKEAEVSYSSGSSKTAGRQIDTASSPTQKTPKESSRIDANFLPSTSAVAKKTTTLKRKPAPVDTNEQAPMKKQRGSAQSPDASSGPPQDSTPTHIMQVINEEEARSIARIREHFGVKEGLFQDIASLEGQKKLLTQEIATLTARRREAQSQPDPKDQRIAQLTKKNKEKSEEITNLRHENAQFQQPSDEGGEDEKPHLSYRELLKDNEKKKLKIKDLYKGLMWHADKLADQEAGYEKICDGTIAGEWHLLVASITQAVLNCLEDRPLKDVKLPQGDGYANSLLRLAQEPEERVCMGTRIHIYQRYIWYRICRDIFGGQQPIWGGPLAASFTKFSQDIEDVGHQDAKAAKAFSALRSNFAHQLDTYYGMNPEGVEKYTGQLVRDLEPFAKEDEKDDTLLHWISEAVNKANELRIIMMKSRALFRIVWPALVGVKGFSKSNMESKVDVTWYNQSTQKEKREVLQVVSPSLLKCGLADGYDFHKHTTLIKARIVVAEPYVSPVAKVKEEEDAPARESKFEGNYVQPEVIDDGEMDDVQSKASDETDSSNWSATRG